ESTSVPSRSHKIVVVVIILSRAPSLLFDAPIKALHSGHRLPPQAGDTAEGTAYVGSYNFSSVEDHQRELRAVVEHIYSLQSRLIGTGAVRDRHIFRTLVRK